MRSTLVLLFLLSLMLLAIITKTCHAVPTVAVLECWKALSYDMCTVQDATGICSSKFQQDVIVDADYRLALFNYLVERYATQTVGVSIETILSQTLSPLNSTYASQLDAAYGSACNTDASVAALLSVGVSEQNAQSSRYLWLLLLQQASFCSANEVWVLNQGCICKEDKDCDELSESEHGSLLKAIGLVLAIFVVIQIFTYVSLLRQIWTIFGGYDAIKSAIEYLSQSVRDGGGGGGGNKQVNASISASRERRSDVTITKASRRPSMSSLADTAVAPVAVASRKITQLPPVQRPSPPVPTWTPPAPHTASLPPQRQALDLSSVPKSPFSE